MIEVVYPYIPSSSNWEELRFSLRSLRHLQEDFRVWIVGHCPEWAKVNHIKHDRITGRVGTKIYDSTHKLETVLQHESMSDTILWMNDDQYFLKDVSIAALDHFYCVNLNHEIGTPRTRHQGFIHNTVKTLVDHGYAGHNCSTHLPMVYRREELLEILQRFKVRSNQLLPSSMWHNIHHHGKAPVKLRLNDPIKAGFYGEDSPFSIPNHLTRSGIEKIFKRKMVLSHNNQGLSELLKIAIIDRFGMPSPYEK